VDTVSSPRPAIVLGLLLLAALPLAAPAEAIPYFARKYEVTCATCHVQPPMLNSFGEAFRTGGYRFPGREARRTVPLAIWASMRSDAFLDEPEVSAAVRAYVNKLELISGGEVTPWLSYFVEWRTLSLEPVRREGAMVLRDRSGRFEDVFVTAAAGNLELTLGQFRQIDQVDVSLRLGLSEPLPLSASLPGVRTEGTARQRSLRGFSPAGRSPSARLAWRRPLDGGWSWWSAAALPLPGEFSIPLSSAARVEASNEIEWRPKGVFLESFVSRGLHSAGGHLFVGEGERLLAQAVTTGSRARFFWTGVAGVERVEGVSRGRWSLEAQYVPTYHFALGGRIEDRAGDGAPAALLPYLRAHFPGTRYTVYVGMEQRVQSGNHATLIEFGTVF
jgi:hypothetical protein